MRSARPAMARWNACECWLTMPGSCQRPSTWVMCEVIGGLSHRGGSGPSPLSEFEQRIHSSSTQDRTHPHPNPPGPRALGSGAQRRARQCLASAPLRPLEGEGFKAPRLSPSPSRGGPGWGWVGLMNSSARRGITATTTPARYTARLPHLARRHARSLRPQGPRTRPRARRALVRDDPGRPRRRGDQDRAAGRRRHAGVRSALPRRGRGAAVGLFRQLQPRQALDRDGPAPSRRASAAGGADPRRRRADRELPHRRRRVAGPGRGDAARDQPAPDPLRDLGLRPHRSRRAPARLRLRGAGRIRADVDHRSRRGSGEQGRRRLGRPHHRPQRRHRDPRRAAPSGTSPAKARASN